MPSIPLIIAHRGASGELPEHTLEAHQRALDLGADALETDVVLTCDGQLLCRHDAELSLTTDVPSRAEFASRKTTRTIDGVPMAGWFIDDFTLEEIRTLRARQRFDFRDRSFDGRFSIPTLADLLAFAAARRTKAGDRPIVVIEIKHAAYFASKGLSMSSAVAKTLADFNLTGADAPAWVESFEIDVLQQLRGIISTPIVQLLDAPALRPADVAAAGGTLTFGDMITPAGLKQIASYAFAIGAWKRLIVPALSTSNGPAQPGDGPIRLAAPTTLVADAHAAGLRVHAWTFRNEPQFLAEDYAGDPAAEVRQFKALDINGIITDFPGTSAQCKVQSAS